jgi:hypothetical protein
VCRRQRSRIESLTAGGALSREIMPVVAGSSLSEVFRSRRLYDGTSSVYTIDPGNSRPQRDGLGARLGHDHDPEEGGKHEGRCTGDKNDDLVLALMFRIVVSGRHSARTFSVSSYPGAREAPRRLHGASMNTARSVHLSMDAVSVSPTGGLMGQHTPLALAIQVQYLNRSLIMLAGLDKCPLEERAGSSRFKAGTGSVLRKTVQDKKRRAPCSTHTAPGDQSLLRFCDASVLCRIERFGYIARGLGVLGWESIIQRGSRSLSVHVHHTYGVV